MAHEMSEAGLDIIRRNAKTALAKGKPDYGEWKAYDMEIQCHAIALVAESGSELEKEFFALRNSLRKVN